MMYKLNKREKKRDNIIFCNHDVNAYSGGIRHFKNLS